MTFQPISISAGGKDTTEPKREPTEESPGPEKATGSESLLPVKGQTLGPSVPSSSLMASTPQEEAVLPNGSTASEIVPGNKGLGPVDDDQENFEEKRKSGTLQAEMASRTETEVKERDVEIPEVEEAHLLNMGLEWLRDIHRIHYTYEKLAATDWARSKYIFSFF